MHHHTQRVRGPESGNAFWFILLAIALLVALTVAITRSGENTEETGQRDRDRIQASDILRQAKSIEAAIQQMRSGGIAENDVSFQNASVTGYENPNCPTESGCRVFGGGGAGLTYKVPLKEWLDSVQSAKTLYGEWYFFATSCVPGVGTGGAGCNAAAPSTELIVALPWITRSLCIELNRLAGVQNETTPQLAPPQISGSAYSGALDKYTGVFSADSEIDSVSNAFRGRPTGCFAGDISPAGGYHFYHVLIAR